MMHEPEKSDPSTVAAKPANKSEGSDADPVPRCLSVEVLSMVVLYGMDAVTEACAVALNEQVPRAHTS